jgi:hypothetical protein
MRRAWTLLAGLLLAAGASAATGQELGRLFFTPQQRAALDARRKARVPDQPAAITAAESPSTRLDGYVKRSDGESTVWLNGQPVPAGKGSNEAQIHTSRNRPDTVTVEAGGGKKRRVPLRVGETLERDSGEVKDVLGGGTVKVSPPPGSH